MDWASFVGGQTDHVEQDAVDEILEGLGGGDQGGAGDFAAVLFEVGDSGSTFVVQMIRPLPNA